MGEYYYKRILDYMRKHDTINDIEAYNLCHTMRLSAVIHRLRQMGYNIVTEEYKKKHDDGKSYAHARYRLIESETNKEFMMV